MPSASIVIPVYGRAALTERCLAALLEAPPETSFEVIVVDDASRDHTPEVLARFGDAVRVVTHAENAGFARSCNDGGAVAEGEYLVLLNNDTVPRPGWLDALVRYAEANGRAGVIGAKLLFPDETIQHAGVVICQDLVPRHLYAGFPADHPAVRTSRRFQAVTAACALIRRSVFEELDGFDPVYENGYEDVDFCLRAAHLGHEVHYCADSVVHHLESVSRARELDNERNGRIYLERWGDQLRPDDLDYFVADGLLRVEYTELYPLRFAIDPQLGVADTGGDHEERVARLVTQRSRQVFDLLSENIRLSVDAAERAVDEPLR